MRFVNEVIAIPNIIEIDDLQASELDVYARLTERQLRHCEFVREGLFIAESPKVIARALDAGYEPVSFLVEKSHIEAAEERNLWERCPVPIYTADIEILTQLTGFALTRGTLCAMKRRALPAVGDILRHARRIAVLEEVMNPTNVGAIFRSAAALNADAILLTNGSSDPLYRRSARVSMGTVFQVPWTYIERVEDLHEYGFCTVAMALAEDAISLADERLKAQERLALVFGTEGDGLSPATLARCDMTVRIPMGHGVDSLNVAAASAVAFWELMRS